MQYAGLNICIFFLLKSSTIPAWICLLNILNALTQISMNHYICIFAEILALQQLNDPANSNRYVHSYTIVGLLSYYDIILDDIIKWKHFSHYWPFVRGIHRSMVNFPQKGQWHRAMMFSLICAWINGWVNSCEAGDVRCHHTHYDVTAM